jgi:hypothetical protein
MSDRHIFFAPAKKSRAAHMVHRYCGMSFAGPATVLALPTTDKTKSVVTWKRLSNIYFRLQWNYTIFAISSLLRKSCRARGARAVSNSSRSASGPSIEK